LGEQVDELALRVARGGIARRVALAVLLLDLDRVRLLLERDRLDRLRLVLDLGDELVVARRRSPGPRVDQPLREEREHDHDQDREGRAAEEAPHAASAPVPCRAPPRQADAVNWRVSEHAGRNNVAQLTPWFS